MAKHADMKVFVGTKTDSAVLLTFYEDLPEETEEWIPFSQIEDIDALDNVDKDGNAEVSITKWILKEKGIEYDSDSTDNRFKR